MSLKSPQTYGEWYWKYSVDAEKEFNETVEEALSPFFSGLLGTIPELADLPSGIQTFIQALAKPPSPGLAGYLTITAGEFGAELLKDTLAPAMSMLKRAINKRSLETWLTGQQAITLSQRKKITEELFYSTLNSEGYADVMADHLYSSQLPYPAVSDIMRFARYHGNPVNTKEEVWKRFDVPVDDYDMQEWLTLPQLSTDQIHSLFRRNKITEPDVNFELQQLGWRDYKIDFVKELGWIIPNPMLLTQGNLQQGKRPDELIADITKADIHPEYAQTYLDAILTKPATAEIVAYELRVNPSLSGLDDRLRKIGIHPDYLEIYKELSYVIPPVADIITMAVREAFTPEIAAKFGQYEDFPAPLEEWAAKKGLSAEWAQRYWAAHWALPSSTQGFAMLHRGVIDQSELNMLLRAQDVMPFWREKLTQIAYRPLTRVDVRRMYREGVLDESEVYEAYLDHGYAEENAERMTEYTVLQALTAMAKFTSRDVITAFAKRMISNSEARSLLSDLGIRSKDVSYILSRAEYKRKWDLTDSQISGIRNLYKKGVYDENAARAKLLGLNLPSDEVDVLFEQWWYEKVGELAPTFTKAETIRFAKSQVISRSRAGMELERMGYDEEHINIYLRGVE